MDLIHRSHVGFVYVFECIGLDGNIKWVERKENIIPNGGRDYILTASLLGGSQLSNWYIGLYSTSYTPLATDTMTSLMSAVTEITTYTTTGSLRLTLTPGALSSGVFSNVASPAQFTATSAMTVNGGFICSNASQGATAGTLLSAVANTSTKTVNTGEILQVTAGLSLTTS